MKSLLRILLTSAFGLLFLGATALLTHGQGPLSASPSFAVTHYDVWLEPNIASKSLKGTVVAHVVGLGDSGTPSIMELDCGDLTVDSVREGNVSLKYSQANHRLIIPLPAQTKKGQSRQIEISYHGAPRRGIRFFPELMQAYTVFSTSQWMICDDDPNERATLRLRLVVPSDLSTAGNGRFVASTPVDGGKSEVEWRQELPVPSYTFGFVIGRFRTVSEKYRTVDLRYLGSDFYEDKLRRIFHDTTDMIRFYEDRAGVKYPGPSYTQVLAAGNVEQEMAGFTALGEKYGSRVLADERDIWLGAHELAHQWWGIMVGCRAWTHFWLNEGMATFMAAAYKEHRFGRTEYLKEIEASRKLYEKVRAAGKDRSLVFPDWLHPTNEDRSLVYDKGAYVLHLLRLELGEQGFWSGIRSYTKKYFGKSVTTADFQAAMEQASGKNLSAFFNKWVYLKGVASPSGSPTAPFDSSQ